MKLATGVENTQPERHILLYADDELLYDAPRHTGAGLCAGPNAAPAPPLENQLVTILSEYVCNARSNDSVEPLQRRFEVIAQTNPGARAVKFQRALLTYGELDAQSDELALHLQQLGVPPGAYCAFLLEPSVALVRGILAVLKAGAACLQFDPALPGDRIAAVLSVFKPAVLFTRQGDCADARLAGIRTIPCNEEAADLPWGWPDEFPVRAGTPAHALATLSDSGSLCLFVRTHGALKACLNAMRGIAPPTAFPLDLAALLRPLSEGALLTIEPTGIKQ